MPARVATPGRLWETLLSRGRPASDTKYAIRNILMSRTDRLLIRDLLLRGIVGVNPEEREAPQDILVNLTLFVDLRRAGQSDDLNDTVSYSAVAKQVRAHVESAQRFTVEALAEDLARIALGFPGVKKARVRVEKPAAVRGAAGAGVEIERRGDT